MMKIVINKSYGGFDLSFEAMMLYAELSGIKLYPFIYSMSPDGSYIANKFQPLTEHDSQNCLVHYATEPLTADGQYIPESYFSSVNIRRNDKNLVRVVEQLGEKANGDCAKLKVVEIPDDVDWEISDYDGMEYVAEAHRKWQ